MEYKRICLCSRYVFSPLIFRNATCMMDRTLFLTRRNVSFPLKQNETALLGYWDSHPSPRHYPIVADSRADNVCRCRPVFTRKREKGRERRRVVCRTCVCGRAGKRLRRLSCSFSARSARVAVAVARSVGVRRPWESSLHLSSPSVCPSSRSPLF